MIPPIVLHITEPLPGPVSLRETPWVTREILISQQAADQIWTQIAPTLHAQTQEAIEMRSRILDGETLRASAREIAAESDLFGSTAAYAIMVAGYDLDVARVIARAVHEANRHGSREDDLIAILGTRSGRTPEHYPRLR